MAPATCPAGFADCDGDLASGNGGSGCETKLSALGNCGACGHVCEAPAIGYAACENATCLAYSTAVGAPRAVSTSPHGSVGGQAYDQTCPAGEVLVGLDVVTSGDIAFGINVLCAPLSLTGTAEAPKLEVGELHAPRTVVGGIIEPMPPTVRFQCPANTIIAGVAGVTYIWTDGMRMSDPSIRSISLACNEIAFDAQGRLVFTPVKVLEIGDRNGEVSLYTDMCEGPEVVVGFKGYAGAFIDALQTWCSAVSLRSMPL
jgi:hypothetical protein